MNGKQGGCLPPPCHADRFVNVIVKGMLMCASEYRSRLHLACKPSCCSNCGRPRRGQAPALHQTSKLSAPHPKASPLGWKASTVSANFQFVILSNFYCHPERSEGS